MAFILDQCHVVPRSFIGSSEGSCRCGHLIHHVTGYTLKVKKVFLPQKTSFAAESMETKIRPLKLRDTYGMAVFN